ncbi:50S ribosomal protein L32 [Candidatus Woesebacteria bacterium]|nr:50S ribosomal protein L32 [Candidatus Woesebacteria bacterium]
MAPLPKKKHTRSRSNKRRFANMRMSLPNLIPCPSCKKPKLPHIACPHCGYYK